MKVRGSYIYVEGADLYNDMMQYKTPGCNSFRIRGCKGKCADLGKGVRFPSRRRDGFKYCTTCAYYTKMTEKRCPCCRRLFRLKLRDNGVKKQDDIRATETTTTVTTTVNPPLAQAQ